MSGVHGGARLTGTARWNDRGVCVGQTMKGRILLMAYDWRPGWPGRKYACVRGRYRSLAEALEDAGRIRRLWTARLWIAEAGKPATGRARRRQEQRRPAG